MNPSQSPIAPDLYKAFLDEVQALENFRVSYTSVHATAGVEREDPEVRRLIDAMAFFTARTRNAALRNLLTTQRRLFQQYFGFLLSPMPAMAMLQAQTSGQFVEPALLPRNTDVQLTTENGRSALFHTTRDVRILPIRLDDVTTLLLPRAGLRVVLSFKTPYPRSDEVGTLPLYVNHLDDYPASLSVLWNLEKHIERVGVVFDEDVTDATEGTVCEFGFGAQDDADVLPDLPHPIQGVRSFFHYPQSELYFNVKVPGGARNWKRFNIFFDLGAKWPKSLRLNKDMFQLFTVPLSNLNRSMAAPILAEGVESRFPIRFPNPVGKFALHSIVGVFEILEAGMAPLKPGIVAGGAGSYEVEEATDAQGQVPTLKLEFPAALADPRKIAVDAFWIQPWFSEEVGGKLRAILYGRNVPGATFELRGDVKPHLRSELSEDFEGMLQVLALKGKAVGFNKDDMGVLLSALGVMKKSYYQRFHAMLRGVAVTSVPVPRELGGGHRHHYKLTLDEAEATQLPLVSAGLSRLAALLRAWTVDADVVVEARIPGQDDVLKA